MRWLAGLLYGIAAAAGSGDLLHGFGIFALIFLGTVCALYAVQAIVLEALAPQVETRGDPPIGQVAQRALAALIPAEAAYQAARKAEDLKALLAEVERARANPWPPICTDPACCGPATQERP